VSSTNSSNFSLIEPHHFKFNVDLLSKEEETLVVAENVGDRKEDREGDHNEKVAKMSQ
jgi:hypothetical protein